MTDNEIITVCEKIDSLHAKILKSKFAEKVTESEMLSLILAVKELNRQRAENERLKDLNNQLETDIINANMNLEHITYEFDLLKQEKSVVIAEAIKEFAERFKQLCGNDVSSAIVWAKGTIDNLVKETVGEG